MFERKLICGQRLNQLNPLKFTFIFSSSLLMNTTQAAPIARLFKLRLLAWLTLLAALVNPGCDTTPSSDSTTSTSNNPQDGTKIKVVATVGMVADMVQIIGGSQVSVSQMMGPGVDPHLYKATRDDVQSIMNADIVFYSGLMLEGRLTDTLSKLAGSTPSIAVTSQLPQADILQPPDSAGHADPHVWTDVSLWARTLPVIVDSLSELHPEHRAEFQDRADQLQQQLTELHEYGKSSVQSIPENQRVLITSHDAFRYFGRAYGIEVIGVQGLSTESEAGLQRINELVDLLVERRIAAVFVESSVPQKNINALIDGAASRGHKVHIGGELFSDAMGTAGTWEGTYQGMMDHNFTRVTTALGGQAAENGMYGKLTIHK